MLLPVRRERPTADRGGARGAGPVPATQDVRAAPAGSDVRPAASPGTRSTMTLVLPEMLRPKILFKDIGARPQFWVDWTGDIVPRHSVYYLVPRDAGRAPGAAALPGVAGGSRVAGRELPAGLPTDTCACRAACCSGCLCPTRWRVNSRDACGRRPSVRLWPCPSGLDRPSTQGECHARSGAADEHGLRPTSSAGSKSVAFTITALRTIRRQSVAASCTTCAPRVNPSPVTSPKDASRTGWTSRRPPGGRASSTWWSQSPTASRADRT